MVFRKTVLIAGTQFSYLLLASIFSRRVVHEAAAFLLAAWPISAQLIWALLSNQLAIFEVNELTFFPRAVGLMPTNLVPCWLLHKTLLIRSVCMERNRM
jgi:hypothetical protein